MPWFSIRDRDSEDVPVLYPFIMRVGTIDVYVLQVKLELMKYKETLVSLLVYMNTKGVDVFHIVRGPAEGKSRSVTYFITGFNIL